jgi:cyclopropane fatty-acyl-phospholipid synthase-like methyltransferase
VPQDLRLTSDRFPRASRYNPDWLISSISGGANSLWLAEWLSEVVDLKPGMRVLDLGCGRAAQSIFLAREFGVQVWAADLWFSAAENQQRIRDAGVEDRVTAVHADARSLPFEPEAFDAILCIDSFPYFATDDHCLAYLARLAKPEGVLALAGACMLQEIEGAVPEHLAAWWDPSCWALHSPGWWRRHWEKTGFVTVERAESMPHGWKRWLEWQRVICPENSVELQAVEADAGRYFGYLRLVARRRPGVTIDGPITTVPTEYTKAPLLRGE